VRVIARAWSRLRLDWEVGLHRLPFFTQKVAVMLLGALVATLALLGGVVSLVGPPGADGPDQLVPGDAGGSPATTRPAPGHGGGQGAGGATAPAPVGAPAPVPARRASQPGRGPAGPEAAPGAGGGAPAAPPTTTASTTTTTTGQGGLPPLEDVVSSVLSTLLP
jgi:hypothetical protein